MRRILLIILFVTASAFVWAGDVAQFRLLGFSPDGRFLDFASYGIDAATGFPYAETGIVDVVRNVFVPHGTAKRIYPVTAPLGDDGFEALLALYDHTAGQRKEWKIDPLRQGRTIYLRVLSEKTQADYDNFQFLDYVTGKSYDVHMHKTIETDSAGKIRSKFYIQLNVKDKAGKTSSYTVGHPDFIRPGVSNYIIDQMILAPNSRSLVFVIERDEPDGNGSNVRNMVETLVL
ncbi:MAG: DUF2259 domain-containing protein [Spirochaetales bacterium]|nr:DUF2259 domain-containing protein [Spirochaetales bacterium]